VSQPLEFGWKPAYSNPHFPDGQESVIVPDNEGFPSLTGSIGGQFMDQIQEIFYLGQFVLDRSHIVTAWDVAMENFSGVTAEEIVNTSDHWRFFYSTPQPTLADFYLKNDFKGAQKRYGSSSLMRIPDGGGWGLLHPSPIKGAAAPGILLVWVTALANGGAVQAIYNGSHLNNFSLLNKERFQGMRILAEQVPAGVCLMQDGKVILVNRYMSLMFGYTSPEEMINKPSTTVLEKSEHQKHLKLMANLHKKKDTKRDRYQWAGVDKLGKEVWFEGQPVPIQWNGRPAVLSLVVDITDFKKREATMEKMAQTLKQENDRLKSSIDCRNRMGNIIGKSQKMQEVYEITARAAFQTSTIAIYGETGTGKELVAQTVHSLSHRFENPFVPVNCGAIPEELFESAFFGHKKGAFTGAVTDKQGLLCAAQGGTLFLDEVGELSLRAQTKLLRALGSGEYTPVGCENNRKADFRLVVATNKDLALMVKEGKFRQDLFYRVHIIPIFLPPLRDRKEDIPILVKHFLNQSDSSKQMSSKDVGRLILYDWPGNVRELHNVMERYIAMGNLDFFDVPDQAKANNNDALVIENLSLRENVDQYESRIILDSLKKYSWNRTQAASALGLPRKTLFRKMKKYNIDDTGI
jgi:PAS domain S-box-containing protein